MQIIGQHREQLKYMELTKMSKPQITIHNAETDEIVTREMTDEEFAQYQADQEANTVRQAEAEAKAQAKAELLQRLGITEDEARLLLA